MKQPEPASRSDAAPKDEGQDNLIERLRWANDNPAKATSWRDLVSEAADALEGAGKNINALLEQRRTVSERGKRYIRCAWVVEHEWGYGKAMRVVESDHPRFVVGSRFDYGFLRVSIDDGYAVHIEAATPEVLEGAKQRPNERNGS